MTDYTPRPDRFDQAGQPQLIDAHDLEVTQPGVRALATWTHDRLGLRPGDSALDVGSGTGSEVFTFADAVGPHGTAVGAEPDPNLLAAATRRAAERGSTAAFVSGDAYGLPFGDNTFDAVLCERVFQHLTAPARAAAEIARVLRPHGRAVVVDADWATAVIHPGDPKTARSVIDTLISSTTNPLSGRRLAGLLTDAGLTVDEIGSHALIQDRTIGAGALVTRIADLAVLRGTITPQARDQLLTDLQEAAPRGHTHISVTVFATLAHKN
ncbi:methyltransferase domain-containing protein [Nocardia caishijiensis]|uniref:Methyltransferase family protein n=1 Tax=Nocardia caishijiensis TaxID=184756 RepID=A0ABQ6YFJ2_9NOCA|nr:methyltransferase domain-containing protein [Nocardia caishijiensis]KAF0836761.1 methyltransferase family protein [Nocardia caishijiensis]